MSDYEDNFSDNENSDNSEDEFITKKQNNKKINKHPIVVNNIDKYNNPDDDVDVDDDMDEDDEDEDVEDDIEDEDDSENEYDYQTAGEKVNDENDMDENMEPNNSTTNANTNVVIHNNYDTDDDTEDEDKDENYLQKFDSEITKNYINDYHPECYHNNYDEIMKLTKIVKNESNIIIDPFHRTIPYLTKYEKTRVLGQRAKQIEYGSIPFVKVPEHVIEPHIIAELELQQKKIPFIIRRPLPNGSFEYWNLKDLEILTY